MANVSHKLSSSLEGTLAEVLCRAYHAHLTLVSAVPENEAYLSQAAELLREKGHQVDYTISDGSVVEATCALVEETGIDLVVTSTRGGSGARHWLTGGVASRIVQSIDRPVPLAQSGSQESGQAPRISKLLVSLDGPEFAERVLPYALLLARSFQSEILLLSVPEVPEAHRFGAVVDPVKRLRREAEIEAWQYFAGIFASIQDDCPSGWIIVTGSRPASTIVSVGESEEVDLIMLATHRRGGLDRLWMGNVAERVVRRTRRPVLLLPVRNERTPDQRLSIAQPLVATVELAKRTGETRHHV